MPRKYSPARMVYVITTEDGWPCKIGMSTNLAERLAQLQVGNWNKLFAHSYSFVGRKTSVKRNAFTALFSGASKFERLVHAQLTDLDLHISGEWFDVSAEDADAVIAKVAQNSEFDLFGLDVLQTLARGSLIQPVHELLFNEMITAEKAAQSVLSPRVDLNTETDNLGIVG